MTDRPLPPDIRPDPYAHLGDEHFPRMTGQREGAGPLIDLPHRGNQLHVRCLSCAREGHISGRRLATEYTVRLADSTDHFVTSLRCTGCGGRRLIADVQSDPGASGFQTSTQDVGQVIWAQRLNTWLHETGTDIWAFRHALRDCPPDGVLTAAGVRRQGPSTTLSIDR